MDFKSQKLTNILLLIITSILVLVLLWAICKGISHHKWNNWHFNKYQMSWNHEKCGMWSQDGEHKGWCENSETCTKHQEELAE